MTDSASGSAAQAATISPLERSGERLDSTSALSAEALDKNARALLAMTNVDYPVTPGDVYNLVFLRGATSDSVAVVVGTDYAVNMGVFGVVNARGQSFDQFKRSAERLVSAAYPGSMPQVLVSSTGVFKVMRLGETNAAGEYGAWGLMRLSELYAASRNAYSSPRAVTVKSTDGIAHVYDLFKAQRYGDLKQDPYLKPGDSITLARYDRIVTITGSVRRPGSYYLLPGEALTDLVERYADGMTEDADPTRTTVSRIVGAKSVMGERLSVSYSAASPVDLMNRDSVTIAPITDLLPVCWFEGAIALRVDGISLDSSNRVPYTFQPGAVLSKAVLSLRGSFSAVSDLPSAYVVRGTERIPVDLEMFLYGKDFSGDMVLQPGDRVVVPFRQLFITLAGAVRNPGRYPYIPDRSWDYYVNLAGGFDTDKNSGEAINIIDIQGRQYKKDRVIQPEDVILAKSNSLVYKFGRIATILSSILSLATLTVTILTYAK
ncbi:MAG: hypothetical protein A2Y38_10190 [Spirochaetes bacterium GWB1_59_5]|nr:MAG: hypothetical protein A2Y38_10190 [Spirochaetes bacterium GWB1_59_5]